MNFKEATDVLSPCVTQEEIAAASGLSIDSVRRARYAKGHQHHRSPPKGWPAILARLARAKAKELDRLAEQLEEQTSQEE